MKVTVGENIHAGDIISAEEIREYEPVFPLEGSYAVKSISRWMGGPREAMIEPYALESEPEPGPYLVPGDMAARVASWSRPIEPGDPLGVDMGSGEVYKINTPQALSWIGQAASRWAPGDEESQVVVYLSGTRPMDSTEVDPEHQPEQGLPPSWTPGDSVTWSDLNIPLTGPNPSKGSTEPRKDEVDLTPEEMEVVAYALCFARSEDMAEKLGVSQEEAQELRDRVYNKLVD